MSQAKYYLNFKYIYSFYSDGVLMLEDVLEQRVEISHGCRFTLHDQEDGSFLISDITCDSLGEIAVLTFPNKDTLLLRLGKAEELSYDEYYSAMGDDNHNVYLGTVTFERD